jgi:hypothetical protein
MPIFNTNKSGTATFTRGRLANNRGNLGTIKQAVTDGDTIRVSLPGGQGLRMLGCDTPEKKIEFPSGGFVPLNDARWKDYFATLWDDSKWGAFNPALPAGLKAHLKNRMKADVTENHWKHATAATKGLADLLEEDRIALAISADKLSIFAAFAHEILDRYGRPLVFINADVPDEAKRPEIYNARMIGKGFATPFFMWPNVEPFRKMKIADAAVPPKQLRKMVKSARKLQAARAMAAAAREMRLGIYDAAKPLQLQASELRFLARRAAPDRCVIDIGQHVTDSKLIKPDRYIDVPNAEDRLYIPAEYVPLFQAKGWTL